MPDGWEPDKLELYLPPDGEPNVVLTADLETGPFLDPHEHDHELSQWQIGKQIGSAFLFLYHPGNFAKQIE